MQFKFCWLLEFKQISLITLNISFYFFLINCKSFIMESLYISNTFHFILYILKILAYFKHKEEQKIFFKKSMLSNIQF